MARRRASASKFLSDENTAESEAGKSTFDKVVELLNSAPLQAKDAERVSALKKVQELIVHKEANLLDNFLDEMLAFQNDKSQDVRKFIIGFMEEACKKDSDVLSKVVVNLALLLEDDNVNIRKRAMVAVGTVYRIGLGWLAKSKAITEVMQQTWTYIIKMKDRIKDMLGNDNDGIRTHAIKFLENLVLTLSIKHPDSDIPKKSEQDMTLDQLPETHHFIKYKKLETEGHKALELVLNYQASQHISSANLMTSLGSLTAIAKQRPQFMSRVIPAFEALHVNLPPTLAKSQVSSVRKNLKMMLLMLLKHPASLEYQPQITTLLTDLGATHTEVSRAMPKIDLSKKRKAEEAAREAAKKAKIEEEEDSSIGMTPFVSLDTKPPERTAEAKKSAVDITAEELRNKLTPPNVTDLVLLSMVMLPSAMPAHFQSTYTPIAAAGTEAQIKHMARLLAMQLHGSGMGKGYEEHKENEVEKSMEEQDGSTSPEFIGLQTPKHSIQTVVSGEPAMPAPKMLPPLSVAQTAARKGPTVGKQFKLTAVTKPLNPDVLDNMTIQAFTRILKPNRFTQSSVLAESRTKILASIVAQFGGPLKTMLIDYIFADLRNLSDIAFAWLYQEYVNYQGYNVAASNMYKNISNYDECLTRLLTGLFQRPDQKEGLFSRLLLEAPCITENAVHVLRKYCQDETRVYLGMSTVRDLILKRPAKKEEFLNILLDFTIHEKSEVRNNAIRVIKKLYEREDLKDYIEVYAKNTLAYLSTPKPPSQLFKAYVGRTEARDKWNEDLHKICLYLYLALMPVNQALIHQLAVVYTAAPPEIKRTILRVLENPVRGMGMQSPELLTLVENCPKGAETLVTRIIHILTDKVAPSPELVERVRDLYHKRVPDVRFLIPVLTGLSKKEVLAALPRLIKLNPQVVKEVFTRLLGTQVEASYISPLSPDQLLIALHNIDPAKCDMKTIIKATNLCFGEKEIYTQEVLAVVMQKLMEQTPLPTLLMRTVIQSLSMYPRLIGFVMNILQRLITKQVWKQKKVWEGFVKCCQRTKPQSFQVLLQLPAQQLKNVFDMSSDLFEPLLSHVQSFTPHQKAHIPKAILAVLEKDYLEEQRIAKETAEKALEEERLYKEKLEDERVKQQKLSEERKKKEESVNQTMTGDTQTPPPEHTVMSIGVIGAPPMPISPVKKVPSMPAEPIGTIPAVEPVLSREKPDNEPEPLKSTPDVSNEPMDQIKPHESAMASSDKEECIVKDIGKDIKASETEMDSRSGQSMDSMNAPQKILGDLDVENGSNEASLSWDVHEKDLADSIKTDQESLSLVEKETKDLNAELETAAMGVSMSGSEEVSQTLLDTTASESQSDVEATIPAKIENNQHLEKEQDIDTRYDKIEHAKVDKFDKDALHKEQIEAGKEEKQELHDTEKEFEKLRAELIERKTQYSEDYAIHRKEFEEHRRQCSDMERECQYEEELNKDELELEERYAALVRKLGESGGKNTKSVYQDMEDIKQAWTNQNTKLLNLNQQMVLATKVEGQIIAHISMPEKGDTHTSEEGKDDQHVSEEGKDDQHASEEGKDDQQASEEGKDDQHASEEGKDDQQASEEGKVDQHASEEWKDDQHASEVGKDDQHASEEGKDDQHALDEELEILEREQLSISGESGPNITDEDLSNKEEHVDLSPSKRAGSMARSAGKRKQTVAAPTRKSSRTKKPKH